MNKPIALLPCPFCGGCNVAINNERPADNSGGYFVECGNCEAGTNLRYACGDDPVPLLVEQWNTRAPLKTASEPFVAIGECMADQICQRVAELPDRDSPADWPEAMLVTSDELRNIVLDAINDASQAVAAQAPAAMAVPDDAQIKALMRKHRIWVEVSEHYEDDLPARELRAIQAEEHQFDALVQDLIALAATPALPATEDSSAGDKAEPAREHLAALVEGMSVSVDVSTGEDDAGHRYFGTVTEVMECASDKHGVTLLVQDAKPNFVTQAEVQAEPVYQITRPFPSDPANTWRDASRDAFDLSHPEKRRVLYTAPQAQPADALDAKRYRWLRKQHEGKAKSLTVFGPHEFFEGLEPVGSMPGELDASIDAAMAAAQEGSSV